MNLRTVFSSFALIVALGAIYVGATGAFFTDTYASQDNVFTTEGVEIVMSAIGHTYLGTPGVGEPTDPTGFTYDPVEGNFTFSDLKPLDWGSLDFDIDNLENEAYVCAFIAGEAPVDAEDIAFYNNIQFYAGANQLTFGEWVDLGILSPGGATDYEVDYCFGEPTVNSGGITFCGLDELVDYNTAEGATFSADFYLFAIQTRNNAGFTCDALDLDPLTEEIDVDYDYLADAPETLVGAEDVAYTSPADPGATCDAVVDAGGLGDFLTIQAAEDSASVGDTICVDTGTYAEDVTVDVEGLTILGLNDPKGVDRATVDGRVDIDADGVTISGLEFTNPDAGYAVVIDGVDATEISFNSFTEIGSDPAHLGSAQAIYYVGGPAIASGLTLTNNMIDTVGHPGLEPGGGGTSAKGIFIGDSSADFSLSGVVIEDNMISNIVASSDAFADGGRGGYGILINLGVSDTGSVPAPIIRNNTIETLAGWWVHAIGLETDTPGALVTLNQISDLAGASGDSAGVFFEGNPNSDVDVNLNNFAPSVSFGVAIHPSNPAITVDSENNWWGDADPSDNILENAGTIDFMPFELAAFGLN